MIYSAYACDARTCDEEFLLSKRQYEHVTGRTQRRSNQAVAYRSAILLAGEIGGGRYETVVQLQEAFIVAPHVDAHS